MPWNGKTQMLFGQVDGYCPRHGFRSPCIEDTDSHPQHRSGFPPVKSAAHSPLRPRDLSHYERFEHYHATFYQHIEALAPTPMAGLLVYTAAPDSEGTLGGLVSLGEPEKLGRLIALALEQIKLCASDPLCAEHRPVRGGIITLHGAACHACLFAPETSCERGNKYFDRSLLVHTLGSSIAAFFMEGEA